MAPQQPPVTSLAPTRAHERRVQAAQRRRTVTAAVAAMLYAIQVPMLLAITVPVASQRYFVEPYNVGARGYASVRQLLDVNPRKSIDLFRVPGPAVDALVSLLTRDGLFGGVPMAAIVSGSHVSPLEAVVIFLYIVGQGASFRMAGVFFKRSIDTVSRYAGARPSSY